MLALLSISLTDAAFTSWGWRVAFLLSAVLVGFGLWIRLRLAETPVFRRITERGERPGAPVSEVAGPERRALVAGVLGTSRGQGSAAVMIGSACQLLLMPAFGALSDRMNRCRLYLYGTIAAAGWPFVFFPMIGSGSFGRLTLGVVVALVIHAALSSLAYTLAGVVGGAPAPLILTALLAEFGGWSILCAYVVLTAVLTGVGLALARDPVVESEEDAALTEAS